MKQKIRQRFILGVMLTTTLFAGVPAPVYAAGNTAYLTPPSGTSQVGAIFTVSVDGYVTGSLFGTHGASGVITFPANILSVVSTSTSGTTFAASSAITPDNTGGKITFSQSSGVFSAANNQNVHMFTITFESKASGVADVGFSTFNYELGIGTARAATIGGTYTINSPPPPPPPPPSPSPSPSPSPTPSPSKSPSPTPTRSPLPTSTLSPSPSPTPTTTPSPSKSTSTSTSPSPSKSTSTSTSTKSSTQSIVQSTVSTTPAPDATPTQEETAAPVNVSDGGLKIEDVKVVATRQENSISWKTNNSAAIPTLLYGTSKDSMISAGDLTPLSDGSYNVKLDNLKLGTLYYFTIKAATDNNLLGANYSGVLTTRGYPVQFKIEQNNLLIPGAKVKIGDRTFIANKYAIVTAELGDGTYTALISLPGSTHTDSIRLAVQKLAFRDGDNPPLQSFTLNTSPTSSSTALNSSLIPVIIGGVLTSIGIVGGIVGFFILRKRKREVEMANQADSDLLSASYGSSIEQHRENTPQPNLDTTPRAQPLPQNQYASPPAPIELTPEQNTEQPAVMETSPITVEALPAFNPESLPLPPADMTPSPNQTNANKITNAPQEDNYTDQMAADITRVESSEQSDNDEASAIYDEAKGELDIIHHKKHAPAVVENVAVTAPIEPFTRPDVAPQQNPVSPDVQSAEFSQATSPDVTELPLATTPIEPNEAPSINDMPTYQTPLAAGHH